MLVGDRADINAVLVVFALNGVIFGSWASRVPALATQVGAAEGTLGLALVGASIGMIFAASLTGRLAARYGARVLVAGSGVAACVVLPLLGLSPTIALLGLTLVLLGASVGTLDVAMNIAAVTVVRRTDRPLMPIFHAAFSFGGLLGAAGAALAAFAAWPPLPHLAVVAVIVTVTLLAVARAVPVELIPDVAPAAAARTPIRRPVLWLLAAVALCSAVAEGASADWSALFAVEYRGMHEASAAFVYGTFSVAMAITRLLGERAERRFGPERLLVGGALIAGGGLLLATTVHTTFAIFAGFALAGVGLAYAFPIALSLAGDAGRRADGTGGEREIGFVTTIAYSGFLAGPPLIGGIAHVTDLAVALSLAGVVAALIAPAALAAAAAGRRERRLVSVRD
ncbi:Sugar phosphate permease [Actinokineospora alba]|uniref:Sugar phosphate permease n=1 Tax=Actinokineospora alba TaxID=504798 RepID=A0A1H0KJM3_9PSEU|nr:MFS transporter [Actinokineospora alba]TDP67873.1 sugar phosphate permease [Actinokineospora alba]SDH87981.1 Sugar phosphate permease [Actinokineospora alba]SDO56204.1 Sugar phosphate permease [Actinokineospora alba]